MSSLVVRRRFGRQLLMLLTALFFALAAYDIVTGHWLSGPPERDAETNVITSQGLSQQRTDYLWGSVFMVASVGLVAASVPGLVSRRTVAEVNDEGLSVRIAGARGMVEIPWSHVRLVHSGSDGADELVPTRVLLVEVDDPTVFPQRLWGAEWEGDMLRIDADTWSVRPEDVATHALVAMEAWVRRSAVDETGGEEGTVVEAPGAAGEATEEEVDVVAAPDPESDPGPGDGA